MDAEHLIEEVVDDDPLQEAMDEQNSTFMPFSERSLHASTPCVETIKANPNNSNNDPQYSGTMKRIEALLEGLGESNRPKAEKRIVAYLCKCQLKSLNNEDVDDINI